MNVYKKDTMKDLVKDNSYVGRGIVIGKTEDGTKAAVAYFIMGRSDNSRNRIFKEEGEDVMIYPFDASKVEDPSLIIYAPIRKLDGKLIVTNGDQTDTIRDFVVAGKSFEDALETREFEPDAPNWTPRISGMLTFAENDFTYKMSILKSADEAGTACNRFTYSYTAIAGVGHFLHTYMSSDGNPFRPLQGNPEREASPTISMHGRKEIWENLNEKNKISLYVPLHRPENRCGEIEEQNA
ncbi:MAG: IMP cyclohydrolase [Anaerotignum faecicola]